MKKFMKSKTVSNESELLFPRVQRMFFKKKCGPYSRQDRSIRNKSHLSVRAGSHLSNSKMYLDVFIDFM